jgi:MAC/perforin domain
MKFYNYIIGVLTGLAVFCQACQDDSLETVGESMGCSPDAGWIVDGLDGDYSIPIKDEAISVQVEEGDFLVPLEGKTVYFERNDEGAPRRALLSLCMADGSRRMLSLVQQPASRASSSAVRRSFFRHHGIGYSYNAVGGEFCNIADVRCQLLNRAVLDRVEREEIDQLLFVDYKNEMKVENETYTSVVDYVQNTNFSADVEGQIVIFSGSASMTCSVFEDGQTDSYILCDEEVLPRAEYRLETEAVRKYVGKYPNLLTSSFRRAIERLAATPADDVHAVDSFIATYGTHMVTRSELGAKLSVNVQVDTRKFNTVEQEQALSAMALAALFKKTQEDTTVEKTYQILRDSRCRIEAVGGDLGIIDKAVTKTVYDNEGLSEELLEAWRRSVKFDDDDLDASNVELTDMEVMPIWDLIADPDVARRVEARVTGSATLMQELLGNRNFINTSFPAHPETVTCRIGKQGGQRFDRPDVVDVIAANRHVATVCHEYVPEISPSDKVFVAYPIYEGRVKLTDGLCLHGGKAYRVDWRYNRFQVTVLGEVDSESRVYMNGGALSPVKYSNLEYEASHLILGCERPGGIAIDGSLAGEMVKVRKHFGHFYLENKNAYSNLPGWNFTADAPEEVVYYPEYIEREEYKGRMVRGEDYIYRYNVTEIGYE